MSVNSLPKVGWATSMMGYNSCLLDDDLLHHFSHISFIAMTCHHQNTNNALPRLISSIFLFLFSTKILAISPLNFRSVSTTLPPSCFTHFFSHSCWHIPYLSDTDCCQIWMWNSEHVWPVNFARIDKGSRVIKLFKKIYYISTRELLFFPHHLCKDASDLHCGPQYIDVSCSYKEAKCNSKSPHLEQGRSLGHILTFTPDCPQINSIYVSAAPLQTLSHLSPHPDSAYLCSSMSTRANYHIKGFHTIVCELWVKLCGSIGVPVCIGLFLCIAWTCSVDLVESLYVIDHVSILTYLSMWFPGKKDS